MWHHNYKKEQIAESLTYKNIRHQIVKWQQSQTNIELRKLKEHEQFEVLVTVNEDTNVTASLRFNMCGHKCTLGIKEGRFMISNWTRHVLKCVNTPKRQKRESNMLKYLTNTSTNSTSSHPNTATPLPLSALQGQPQLERETISTADLVCNETIHETDESAGGNWQKENDEEVITYASSCSSSRIDPIVVPHTPSRSSSTISNQVVISDPIVVEDVQPKVSVQSGEETSDTFQLRSPAASNLQ